MKLHFLIHFPHKNKKSVKIRNNTNENKNDEN